MPEILDCPSCSRRFTWGSDGDSAVVDRAGPAWRSCRENGYWKLSFHMKYDHPEALMECPRRGETLGYQTPSGDYWSIRDHHRNCSYCGSMHPDDFFKAIDEGYTIGPTDKGYKAYVHLPNPDAGKQVKNGGRSGPAFGYDGKPNIPDLTESEISAGRYDRPTFGPAPSHITAKFYFQHMSAEQRQKFVDLLNMKKVNIGEPGYFYVRPFFIAPPKPAAEKAAN